MYYDCISVDISYFSRRAEKGGLLPDTIKAFTSQIAACRRYFRFAVVDVGPSEAFANYGTLRILVRELHAASFLARLLTTGRYFRNAAEVEQQFRELASFGVDRIVLRLDDDLADCLPQADVITYVKSCSATGFTPEVRLDFDDSQSEGLFRVLQWLEHAFFYSTIHPKARRPFQRASLDERKPIQGIGTKGLRIVISEDGDIFLREYDPALVETHIGNISDGSLEHMLSPARLAAGLGEICNGT